MGNLQASQHVILSIFSAFWAVATLSHGCHGQTRLLPRDFYWGPDESGILFVKRLVIHLPGSFPHGCTSWPIALRRALRGRRGTAILPV